MRIASVRTENFRSFADTTIPFNDYACLLGPNVRVDEPIWPLRDRTAGFRAADARGLTTRRDVLNLPDPREAAPVAKVKREKIWPCVASVGYGQAAVVVVTGSDDLLRCGRGRTAAQGRAA